MKEDVLKEVKKEIIASMTRNELASLSLDAVGIVLVRATFILHPELQDLPTVGEEDFGDGEISSVVACDNININSLTTDEGIQTVARKMARVMSSIQVPVYESSMKAAIKHGEEHKKIRIILLWIQERK